ncbi:LacI family DNA-binding transcriptional regulator [Arthrobacter sp. M4]|uniref:LacI family DNA-binding transcriptional regulator n=1 Tax=Arthrobacter sp. M4 TaxID=218160 RepID=UPI001CDC15AF|nr:LacI family DNA-binding transcriptional regulator [Arthrobacter sp. M4]MCA4132592.1 LacI family transcriptional regulator [Arthrobacter sp. M4]
MSATIVDVARHAGVSIATASRALSGAAGRKVPPATAEKVHSAANSLGYRPNAAARALVGSSTGLIGLVVHDIGDWYSSSIAKGVHRACGLSGKTLVLASTGDSAEEDLAALRALVSQGVEGIILASTIRHRSDAGKTPLSQLADRYISTGGRLVTISEALGCGSGSEKVLGLQQEKGAAELAAAMVAQGSRRFTIVTGAEDRAYLDRRRAGFVTGLQIADVHPAEVVHTSLRSDGARDAAAQIRRQIIRDGEEGLRHGIFGVTDRVALTTITALARLHLEPPRDYAIAGFDDIPDSADFWPTLTTVRLPIQEIGTQAVHLAIGRQIDNVDLAGEVILRASTSRPTPNCGKNDAAFTASRRLPSEQLHQ